ncbi:putative bifunctional diguanylate cyclase/phosphodiesterase [Glaciecola petra]|uniref:EAL domain-containing protein n=1 Tax=Glaciecola petra TaxID=3075602 RepID=A0ABU2ZU42_9ALTE|nr:EAL domain-containing protein [Aestuariibacter sp. P117]MDT0595553.1 EAL domain-containing protein [Aestuariibacter sp. P117]
MSIQQKRSFDENISSIKHTHRKSARQLLEQHLQEQILSAEEIVMLSDLNNRPSQDFKAFFDPIWSRIQLSFSLSSMSFSNGQQSIEYGRFPREDMFEMQMSAAQELRPQSGIICHFVCELSSSIPVTIEGDQWALSLLSDIAPSIIFLSSVVNSDIGIISPSTAYSSQNNTLSRYVVDIMTGSEKNGEVFQMPLSSSQFEQLESEGMHFKTNVRDYYVWFETIDGIGEDIRLLFIRDISLLLEQQNNQKEQVIVIFATMTFGILLFLILFSFIPISKINQLKRAIKLIGAKEYNIARYRLGKPTKSHFNDELHELEDEFRHAIDVLETYEQQLKASQKRLVRQATIDQITGLFTRNVLVEDLINMNTDPSINEVAIFFLDLDGFKPVNDNLGHEAGDIMLKKIGYRLKGVVNKFTKVYRIGGDEFVICFSNFSSSESLDMMADSVVDLFSAPFHIYDTRISISASIGIAKQKGDEIDADKLLRFADIAMYQAKENGKNCYKFFDDSMRDAAQQRFTIKNDFIASLADNQLFVVFQPIVCSNTRKVIKLEALCRWQHPDLGFIEPPIFIDVLEESENMNMLFEWIVNNVVNEIHYLDSIERNDIIISINLSPSQLVNDLALSVINNVLEEHNISPKRIELEITETSLITNFETAKLWIEDATNAGYKIAIDDFGAGYSSLSYLTAFSYNTVKLDRSLLYNIDKDPRQQRIVGSLTQMLHGLSVSIVAEGAETEGQFMALQKLGCDYVQGFLVSKPIPHDQLVYFLNRYLSESESEQVSLNPSVER